jgi:enamine deaminase RidA (YjgF/YER057c/UK114 family)
MKKIIATSAAPAAIGPYSQAVLQAKTCLFPDSFPSTPRRARLRGRRHEPDQTVA